MQIFLICYIKQYEMSDALVAQLDRASDYGSEGCEFEPRRVRQFRKDFSLGLKSFFFELNRRDSIVKKLEHV